MGNYTKSFNFRNGVQVDDSNFIVNANGLVGIGTSIPEKRLDVRGNTKIIGDTRLVGLTSITDLNVVGVVTIGSAVKIDSGSGIITATKFVGDASGLQNIVAIATDGFIANVGSLSTTAKIGIGSEAPTSQLDVLGDSKFVGFATFAGITTVTGETLFTKKLDVFGDSRFTGVTTFTVGTNKSIQIYAATHNDETNLGAGLGFSRQSDGAALLSGIFGHSDNGLGVAARDHISLLTGGTSNVSDTEERVRITSDGKVGIGVVIPTAKLDVNGNTELDDLNVSGVTTHKDDVEFHGVGGISSITFNKSDNSLRFGDNVKARFGTDSDFEIYHGEDKNFLKSGASTNTEIWSDVFFVKSVTGNGEAIIKGSEGGSVELYHNNVKRVETISTGASVYNQLNVASLDGGTSGLSSHFGSLRYGNEDQSTSPFSTRRSLDFINNDSGNINFYLNANNLSVPVGGGDFHWHKGFNNSQLMTLTNSGTLGIGLTDPDSTRKLHVDGKIKVTGISTFGSDLFVGNNLNVKNTLTVSTLDADVAGNLTGNVNAASGVSTFSAIKTTDKTATNFAGVGIGTTVSNSNYIETINSTLDKTSQFIVNTEGKVAIGTDNIRDSIGLNAHKEKVTFGAVGVGTTTPLAAIDFRDAGQDGEGVFANRMYMLPPQVNSSQRSGLSTVTGAVIFNTSVSKLQIYISNNWVDLH